MAGSSSLRSDDDDFVAAMLRAYNDWHIQEWCGAYPGRFIPLALSGFKLGAEWMAGEIRRVAELGCHAVSWHSEPFRFGMPDYHGDEWDPAFAASQEVGYGGGVPLRWRAAEHAAIPVRRDPPRMPFQTAIFASELLWSPMMRKFPAPQVRPRRRSDRLVPVLAWRRPTSSTSTTIAGPARTSVTSFRARCFSDRVLVCFIDDETGFSFATRSVSTIMRWECDLPAFGLDLAAVSRGADEVPRGGCRARRRDPQDHLGERVCAFYQFDPFSHIPQEQCTVGALRAQATDVDTTPRRYGPPVDDSVVEAAKAANPFAPPRRT